MPTTKQPATPRAAARKRAHLDRLLDPNLFKAVSDPTRAAMLAAIIKCGRACTVTEVAAACRVDYSVVARHLRALGGAGLIESRREGRVVWYRPRCRELCDRLRRLIAAIEEWCPSMSTADCSSGMCRSGKAEGKENRRSTSRRRGESQ